MTERPILFSAPMVRAILAGTKTQTRRVISRPLRCPGWTTYRYFGPSKNDPTCRSMAIECGPDYPDDASDQVPCPYGAVGDRLWVRETWKPFFKDGAIYLADAGTPRLNAPSEAAAKAYWPGWKPSIHMPRRFSRLLLEITGVRVERLQYISEADAEAEGCDHPGIAVAVGPTFMREVYRGVWESIHGAGSWAANPWVWVVEFRRVT